MSDFRVERGWCVPSSPPLAHSILPGSIVPPRHCSKLPSGPKKSTENGTHTLPQPLSNPPLSIYPRQQIHIPPQQKLRFLPQHHIRNIHPSQPTPRPYRTRTIPGVRKIPSSQNHSQQLHTRRDFRLIQCQPRVLPAQTPRHILQIGQRSLRVMARSITCFRAAGIKIMHADDGFQVPETEHRSVDLGAVYVEGDLSAEKRKVQRVREVAGLREDVVYEGVGGGGAGVFDEEGGDDSGRVGVGDAEGEGFKTLAGEVESKCWFKLLPYSRGMKLRGNLHIPL
jgi:hypothetical protein